jgi:hypothetical protein
MVKSSQSCLMAFQKAQESEHDLREQAREADSFVLDKDGQWQDSVVQAMGNRPRFTLDKVSGLLEDMMAEVEGMDFGIRVRPAGGGASKDTAEVFAGIIRHIEDQSNASNIYRNSIRRIMRRGVTFIRLKTDWADSDSFEQDIRIKDISNSIDRCWLGFHEEADGSDAAEGWVVHALTPDEFEERYGRKCQSIGIDDDNASQYREYKPELALYLEYLYKKPYKKTVAQLSDGRTIEVTKETQSILDELSVNGVTVQRQKTVNSFKVYSRFLDASDWLDKEMETVWCSIPIIPVYGSFEISENKLIYAGVVRRLMDPQRIYNYSKSREIEEGALAPRKKLVMSFNQAKNPVTQRQLQNMNTSADPVLFVTPDQEAPPPFETSGPQINPNLANTAQGANADMVEISGVYSAQQGQNPRYQSGDAIELMIGKGDAKTTRWLNCMAIAMRRIAMMLIKAIPKVYDTQRQLRIMNLDGTEQEVTINEEVFDQQTGRMVVLNDMSQGKYDVTVSLDKAYKTQRQEAADRLAQMAAIDPSLITEAADLLYGALDVPGADEIRERKRLQLLKAGAIPDSQMTDEEKEEVDKILKSQQQQQDQQQQEMAPVSQAMQANFASLIAERELKMQLSVEELRLKQQKQVDDLMLKLTELEQKYAQQLNQEAIQNREVFTSEMQRQ